MDKTCSIPDCGNKLYARGFCEKHYQRNRKFGSPDDKKGDHVPLEVKFWRKVDKNGPPSRLGSNCWEWMEFRRKGYGSVWVNGRAIRAHRASWEMQNGPIPDGMLVCHACDNPSCVNPGHLFLGTHDDNMADRAKKKRARAALSPQQVQEAFNTQGISSRAIARKFGVHHSTIDRIKRGEHFLQG